MQLLMNQPTQVEWGNTSLRIVHESLVETSKILEDAKDKLDFVVNGNTPKEESKPASDGMATIEVIAQKMFEIARQASTISKLTNSIVGV